MFTFLRAFSDIPGLECRKQFRVYQILIFFVNYSENYRTSPGGSMGKIIGSCMPKHFSIYFILGRIAITETEEI